MGLANGLVSTDRKRVDREVNKARHLFLSIPCSELDHQRTEGVNIRSGPYSLPFPSYRLLADYGPGAKLVIAIGR